PTWRRLTTAEQSRVFGKSFIYLAYQPTGVDDQDDETCPKDENADSEEADEAAPIAAHDPNSQADCDECQNGGAGDGEDCEKTGDCGTCQGMPVWRVSSPYINLWLLDTPLFYTTSYGKRQAFSIAYKQRNTHDASTFGDPNGL